MSKALVPVAPSSQYIVRATRVVPYLTSEEVYRIADAARAGRNGQRDYLLILCLFETGLRISEALGLTPASIGEIAGLPCLHVIGKGKKPRVISCPETLAAQFKAFAYDHGIGPGEKLFPITRYRAWQIVKEYSQKAGLYKRTHPHLFRHSAAIERLRQVRDPKALQKHLGHESPLMTLRYLSTLAEEDAFLIESQVRFDR